jgi:glutamate dehydrogenase/leucine dehydrogenase
VDPTTLSSGELERLTRRYASEISVMMHPLGDIPAPDVGTNEQVMAWIMDTYSMHAGHSVPAVVTGKPVSIGGSVGRREATGRGVMIAAREVGVRTAARAIFLDNVDEKEVIRQEVQRLIRLVRELREEFDRQGVRLVPLSTLVR